MLKGCNTFSKYQKLYEKLYLLNIFFHCCFNCSKKGGTVLRYLGFALGFAVLCIFLGDISQAFAFNYDYVVTSSTDWNDFLSDQYNNRARVLHGGDTLNILNDSVVTFDFSNPDSATALSVGGCFLYSMDYVNGVPKAGDVVVNGGTIKAVSAGPGSGTAVANYADYPASIYFNNTNLELKNFAFGINSSGKTVAVSNKKTFFDSVEYAVYAQGNTDLSINSDEFIIDTAHTGIRADTDAAVTVNAAQKAVMAASYAGFYVLGSSSSSVTAPEITVKSSRYAVAAGGSSRVMLRADRKMELSAQYAVIGNGDSDTEIYAGGGKISGDVFLRSRSSARFFLENGTVWEGCSKLFDNADFELSLQGSSRWAVSTFTQRADSVINPRVSNLNMKSGGVVDMASRPVYDKLEIGYLQGDAGLFRLKTDIANDSPDTTDQVYAGEAIGNHFIEVISTGRDPNIEEMNTYLVRQDRGDAQFKLSTPSNLVDAGIYTYKLVERTPAGKTEAKEWFLKRFVPGNGRLTPDPKNGTPAVTVPTAYSPSAEMEMAFSGIAGQYALWYGQLTNLRIRLGEVHDGSSIPGLWGRGFADKSELSGLNAVRFSQRLYGASAGYDKVVLQTDEASLITGMQFRVSHADQKSRSYWGGNGDLSSVGGGVYSVWVHKNGWYADTVATFDWYTHKLNTAMLDGTKVEDDRSSYGLGASFELGRKIAFAYSEDCSEYWFIEPQIQLALFVLNGGRYSASNGMDIYQNTMYSFTGRTGAVLGKKIVYSDAEQEKFLQPYVKAGFIREFLGDQKVRINGVRMTGDMEETRIYYGLGVDWQFMRDLRFYAQAEREEGRYYDREYNISAGINWNF